MEKFDFTVEKEIAFLGRFKLNPTEFFIVKLLVLAKENNESIYTFFSLPDECVGSFREILLSLKNKGVFTQEYKIPDRGKTFDPYEVIFNKNFLKFFYRSSDELGKELFDAYPSFTNINGVLTGIRTVSRKYDSLEDFYKAYGRAINYKEDLHNHIIELVNWAKENNLINYSLSSFLIDRRWELLEELKNGDAGNINFDTIKIL